MQIEYYLEMRIKRKYGYSHKTFILISLVLIQHDTVNILWETNVQLSKINTELTENKQAYLFRLKYENSISQAIQTTTAFYAIQ